MYNVIVADDEKNIREGIVELIEWEKLGCKVCASMQNGAQVLKYLEEEKIQKNKRTIENLQTQLKKYINENLYDEEFIKEHTDNFEEYKKIVEPYTPEYAAKYTNIPADMIRKTMREYAKAKDAMILYGMGVCQFSQAVDVVKGLASLALLTGNFGRPNVGIGPVRGQNNVQGACDMGALPDCYPGYQKVTNPEIRAKFEKAWGVKLPSKVGLKLTEVPHAV